ncbi:MAG: NAD-dependent epimerase/dehydratase family protein [Candidatus Limnocylindrales bacterium]
MRIVVTGAAGRIGRNVVTELVTHDHDVLAVDRMAPPDEGPIRGATWARVDVHDLEAMTRLLDRARVEALVHLAAIPSPRLGSPLEVFTTNTQATFAVLEAAGIAGVRRVAIASSTSVTGLPFASPPISPLYVPVDEEHPNVGSDAYALSKETDEATARTMHRRHGYQVVALRISNTAPMAEQQAKAAEVARDPSDLACELWAYLDIRDGARAFRQAVERGVPGCHVINVMAPDTYSAEPTAELLARYHPSAELRRPIVGREVPFDLARSRDLLGFSAEHRLPR